ncbi:hypothetical protein VTH82DRAFT_8513 [Thermothelomyces myriococcoides]
MKTFVLPLAILASSAAAQTTSACAADYVVESCLSTQRAKLDNCDNEEWNCLCSSWQEILGCYINCPDDERQKEDAGQRDIFCGYASQFSSSTTAPSVTSTTSTPADVTDAPTSTESESSTAASTATTSSSPDAAGNLALNTGGLLAAVAGVAAVVL